jgi:hypothetical protein
MKTLHKFLEQEQPAQEPKKEDPKVKQTQAKENMLKKRVLMSKIRAVRQGATGIMASHEPEGEVVEGVMTMIGRKKKKVEKKPEKSMDAGARARRKVARRVHAKYVSGSEDNVPDDIREGSLHKWFKGSKSKDGKGGWVNVKTGGTCASDEPGEGTPKCVSSSKRASMTQAERDSASRRKKAADPNQQQKSGAAKPTYVATDKKKKVNEDKALKTVAKELDGASKMHKGQANKIKKHLKDMRTEACWKGYRAKGMKKKGGKLVPNCKPIGEALVEPKDGVDSAKEVRKATRKAAFRPFNKEDYYAGTGEKVQKRTKKYMDKKGMKGAPGLDAMKARTAEHKAKRGVSEGKGYQPEIEHSKMGDAKKKADKKRDSKLPPHLQGDALGKMKKAFATEEDKKGSGSGTKDACYKKVKASAKVWPSAYASGRLVQCRKKGAANYGSSKKEEVEYAIEEKKKKKNCGCGKDPCITYGKQEEMKEAKSAAWQRKAGKNPEGGLNQKGVDSYRAANPGSKLKTAVTTKPSKLKKGSKSASRRKSFCARMGGMKKKLTSAKTANDPDSRINKSLRKWNCSYEPDGTPIMEEDKAFKYVLAKLKAKHGDGVLTKGDKIKPQSAADKAKARAHQAKVDKENAAERAKDPSQGRYPKG